LVRARLDVSEKITAIKAQIQGLLKRYQLRRQETTGKGWTQVFFAWLRCLTLLPEDSKHCPFGDGARVALSTLLQQLEHLEVEEERLDVYLAKLAETARYAAPLGRMTELCGVGVLTALVFLTEMGDLTRFANRRQIAAYLGLAPSSNESGEADDRKGHITHQGSARVRKVLCQATWARVRHDPAEKAVYERIKAKNPKKKKIAVVASMRRLAVRMFHRGHEASAERVPSGPAPTVESTRQPSPRCGKKMRLRRRIFSGMTQASDGQNQQRPLAGSETRQGPRTPSACLRPGYPLSGCVPAEPDSVSPDKSSIT
jgi:transposase